MREENIEKMDFKELRNEVQAIRDELTLFKRKYNDEINNLDSSNFGRSFSVEQSNLKAQVRVTAEKIETLVTETDLAELNEKYSQIIQTADKIETAVTSVKNYVDAEGDEIRKTLGSSISQTAEYIDLIVRGEYTDQLLKGYFTSLSLDKDGITMQHNGAYSTYSEDGLHFYVKESGANKLHGWALEPNDMRRSTLRYYFNNSALFSFGEGKLGDGYATTDMVLKGEELDCGRFVVDLSAGTNREIKFVGITSPYDSDPLSPCVYVNEMLLATQDWVLNNGGGGGGSGYAIFG